jgi:uncharacterized protein YjbI with pentapeptide repeats
MADVSGTYLDKADLRGANLDGADLRRADLRETLVDPEQLKLARRDE